jgi:hypothetical protein
MRARAALAVVIGILTATTPATPTRVSAQGGPGMLVPGLDVRPIVSGVVTPTSLAFIGPNEFLLLEKPFDIEDVAALVATALDGRGVVPVRHSADAAS